ncbi:MAG: hypothetical protein QOI06_604 [Nocardioidaceae bacterium]|nr:hypothetical protein [Nocardioidaceae bacterium]
MAVLSGSAVADRLSRPPVRRWPTMLLGVGCAGALCCAASLSPHQATNGPVVCPFRLATGLPCPGCGMTRAWVFLAHGRLGDAASANPFAFVTMPAGVLIVLLVVVALVRRRPMPDIGRGLRHPMGMVLIVSWIAFGVVRAVAVLSGHASV